MCTAIAVQKLYRMEEVSVTIVQDSATTFTYLLKFSFQVFLYTAIVKLQRSLLVSKLNSMFSIAAINLNLTIRQNVA